MLGMHAYAVRQGGKHRNLSFPQKGTQASCFAYTCRAGIMSFLNVSGVSRIPPHQYYFTSFSMYMMTGRWSAYPLSHWPPACVRLGFPLYLPSVWKR